MNFRCVTNSRLDFVMISIIMERNDSMDRKLRIYSNFLNWIPRTESKQSQIWCARNQYHFGVLVCVCGLKFAFLSFSLSFTFDFGA